MKNERVIIQVSDEDLHFREEERKKIEKLRAIAAKEADEAYSKDHKNHCFRCGTPSLVEVEHNKVKIDICVNEGCGAVHLDPGEMEKILEAEKGVFGKVKNSVFSVFK
ncbi:MAG: zf-TFIIB domain-containing protein [Thermodesulfobacteriota bacterium]|nr:zf-TFIIB domain-containing protein [Thermodesulfobacteriota bacterium]